MGLIYTAAMMAGAFGYRLPPPGWKPAGWTPPPEAPERAAVSAKSVPVNVAWRTKQFWLLWMMLCMNVTAGIGVLGMASPLIQEMSHGRVSASAAAGFVGLLSLFNMGGRFFWASLSDRIGRKQTFAVFFGLGMVLYASVPFSGAAGSVALFVAIFCVILSMYGGGFSTMPAYLSDQFGVLHVSAILGRLLTAWSTAGILGPVLVNYIREYQIDHGVAPADAYTFTMYVLVGLLAIGFVCNLAVRRVPDALFTLAADAPVQPKAAVAASSSAATVGSSPQWAFTGAAWGLAAVPLGWGVMKTLTLASQIFR